LKRWLSERKLSVASLWTTESMGVKLQESKLEHIFSSKVRTSLPVGRLMLQLQDIRISFSRMAMNLRVWS